MSDLKPITAAGIPGALQKAERYRLLNDPAAAESICLDVLEVDRENQQAVELLLLARTDQFHGAPAARALRARELLPRLRDEYKRTYYAGLIAERRAKAVLHSTTPGAPAMAYEAFREAMEWYEKAEAIRPAGNDEALLRYNTCARILRADPALTPRGDERTEPVLDD